MKSGACSKELYLMRSVNSFQKYRKVCPPQWMNKAICNSLQKNNKLHKIYKKNSTVSNKAEYCNMRAKVKKQLRLAKRLFERHIL